MRGYRKGNTEMIADHGDYRGKKTNTNRTGHTDMVADYDHRWKKMYK